MFISSVWQVDNITHVYTFFFFYILHYGLSQNTEYSSLCCTVGLCLSHIPFKCIFFFLGNIDEDVVVIEASSTPQITANEEINVTSTDSEVEIVTVGESYR